MATEVIFPGCKGNSVQSALQCQLSSFSSSSFICILVKNPNCEETIHGLRLLSASRFSTYEVFWVVMRFRCSCCTPAYVLYSVPSKG